MRLAIAGASGVLGRQVVARCVERGHTVSVLLRSAAQGPGFTALGCRIVPGDLLIPGRTLEALVDGADAVLHLATAVPVAGRPVPPPDANDRLRREGTANLIAATRARRVERYVQQSIALMHVTVGAALGDEATEPASLPISQSAIDMEIVIRASGLDWRILRGGAFYGGGSGRDLAWRTAARRGELQLPGDGSAYISLVHVSDMAAAVTLAAEATPGERAAIVVDDAPVTYRQLFGHIAALETAPPPCPGGPVERPSFRLSNAFACRWLGWRPHFPTYRSGLA